MYRANAVGFTAPSGNRFPRAWPTDDMVSTITSQTSPESDHNGWLASERFQVSQGGELHGRAHVLHACAYTCVCVYT